MKSAGRMRWVDNITINHSEINCDITNSVK
jgi:hypothetical protein